MSENKLKMSSSPHIRSKVTSSNIMLMVTIALLPAAAFGVWNFGLPALGMLVTTTLAAVLTEYIYEKLMHKKITVNDFSAVVTGLLLGLNMPPTAPYWMGALGSVFGILVVKQLFGGLGQNFMNPALGARCFLLISFTGQMTDRPYSGNHRRDKRHRDHHRSDLFDPDGDHRSSHTGYIHCYVCSLCGYLRPVYKIRCRSL